MDCLGLLLALLALCLHLVSLVLMLLCSGCFGSGIFFSLLGICGLLLDQSFCLGLIIFRFLLFSSFRISLGLLPLSFFCSSFSVSIFFGLFGHSFECSSFFFSLISNGLSLSLESSFVFFFFSLASCFFFGCLPLSFCLGLICFFLCLLSYLLGLALFFSNLRLFGLGLISGLFRSFIFLLFLLRCFALLLFGNACVFFGLLLPLFHLILLLLALKSIGHLLVAVGDHLIGFIFGSLASSGFAFRSWLAFASSTWLVSRSSGLAALATSSRFSSGLI